MPDIHDTLDVTFNELTTDQQLQLKEAIDQYQHKCLLSFSKNRSGVPFLKSEMPRSYGHGSANYGRHNGQTQYCFLEYIPTNDD
jgi:hypothetical protein